MRIHKCTDSTHSFKQVMVLVSEVNGHENSSAELEQPTEDTGNGILSRKSLEALIKNTQKKTVPGM